MQQEITKFESWAIVEIMGHIKVAGMCTTQNFGNTVLLRIDIPETSHHPKRSPNLRKWSSEKETV